MKLKKTLTLVILSFFVCTTALAQQPELKKKGGAGPRRQLATIVFAGLGGAILGLSTLSFYGRPQEHLANIAIGFAVGVIAGTIYVTFRTATTREYYLDEKKEIQGLSEPEIKKGLGWSPLISQVDRTNYGYGLRLNFNF